MVIPPNLMGNMIQSLGESTGNEGLAASGYEMSHDFFNNSPGIEYYKQKSDPVSARAIELGLMSEREFTDYEMREAHKLGLEADSSKYQRAYNDLVKAGLNPRLAIESLNGSGVSASSGYSYSQSDTKSQSESKSDSFSASALIVGLILAAIKIAAL